MTAESETPFRVDHAACKCDDIPKELLFEYVKYGTEIDQEEGRVPLVQKYEIPEYFEAHVSLDYLEMLHGQGSDAAFRWAVITAVGKRGWAALRSPGMDSETFGKIAQVILDRVRGASSKGPKGRS